MLDLVQLFKSTREQLTAARIARREAALNEARDVIVGKMGALTEVDLRRVLQLFNIDLVQGRELVNRFATGLVGKNANLLVGRLDGVNAAVPLLWQRDEAWLAANLGGLRHGGSLPGGGWLFLSMVLHARAPSHFLPMTWTMMTGLAAVDGGPVVSHREGTGYLEYCRRLRELLVAHQISPFGADVLLWNAAAMTGNGAAADVEESPEPVVSTPPKIEPVTAVSEPIVSSSSSPQPKVEPTVVTSSASSGAKGAAGSESGAIGWLHLTDLHQGMESSRWLWPNVLAQVFDDLGRLHDASGPWDLVLFTGDLTQRGDADEFKKLDATLDRLWRRFEQLGSRPRLVCVPGNHDLARPKKEVEPVVLALSHWHTSEKLRNYVFDAEDNPYRVRLREVFAAYTEWCERSPWIARDGFTRGALPGDLSLSLSLHGIELGIVGLNSAFLQLTGADAYEQLAVDHRQLHLVCGDYAPEWLQRHHVNLLLTHHPPEWLAPQCRQEFRHEIDVAGRFAAHFFGHMHEGSATSTSHGGGQHRHAIQGASLFGLEEYVGKEGRSVQRIHGYSAGRFELSPASDGPARVRVRIFPRRMFASPSGRRIAPDVQMYDLDERGSFMYEVPAARRR